MQRQFHPVLTIMIGLYLCAATFAGAGAVSTGTGTVVGSVGMKSGGMLAGGTIFFYYADSGAQPSSTLYWLIPTHAFTLDSSAAFRAALPEGDYYFGAIGRKTTELRGPPTEGDYFLIGRDGTGNAVKVTVKRNAVLDLGIVGDAELFRRASPAAKGITSLQGKVVDSQGRPMEGMAIFAYHLPTMFGRPLFASERSNKDGAYELRVAGGGTYYLSARADYEGGPPASGELAGVYDSGHPVVVQTGATLRGIDIIVRKMPPQEKRK